MRCDRRSPSSTRFMLTPLGCSYLFDVPTDTIRQARCRDEKNAVALISRFSDKAVTLVWLDWAKAKWPERFNQGRYHEMLETGHLHGIRGKSHLILHRGPVFVDAPARVVDDLGEGSDEGTRTE